MEVNVGSLEKQRRDALRFECICWFFAIVGPAVAGYLLRHRIPGFLERPEVMVAALAPVFLCLIGAIGFHRLRKGIERKIAARDGGPDVR
jgi:hypothetical protein